MLKSERPEYLGTDIENINQSKREKECSNNPHASEEYPKRDILCDDDPPRRRSDALFFYSLNDVGDGMLIHTRRREMKNRDFGIVFVYMMRIYVALSSK